jgi:DNA modification methylase
MKMSWNGGGRHGVYTHHILTGGASIHRISDHPNHKPIPLLIDLIKDFSNPGDLILDPFGGSGAVAAAAYLTDRRCVVVEKEERYCHDLMDWLKSGGSRKQRKPKHDGSAPLFDLLMTEETE